jgi:hypothetical protein
VNQPAPLAPRGGAIINRRKETSTMFIILAGDPSTGFTAVGPYAAACAAEDDGDYARIEYGGSDWWVLPLNEPCDSNGMFVIFGGDIENPFAFTGPFADQDAARSHGRPLVPNIVLQLMPPSEEAEEAA